jgi:hypothetical protein
MHLNVNVASISYDQLPLQVFFVDQTNHQVKVDAGQVEELEYIHKIEGPFVVNSLDISPYMSKRARTDGKCIMKISLIDYKCIGTDEMDIYEGGHVNAFTTLKEATDFVENSLNVLEGDVNEVL